MRRTVALINTTTYRAGARGIARLNELNDYPGELRLIFDKLSELRERPGVLLSPLAFPNRDAVADTLEVFQCDSPSAVFSLHNNTLRDYVIDVCGKTPLFSGTLFEKAAGCLCALGLKFSPQLRVALPQSVDLITRVGLTIRVGSDILDAQINTKKLDSFTRRRLLYLTTLVKVKIPVAINKVGFSGQMPEKGKVVIAGNEGNSATAIRRPEGNGFVYQSPGQDTLIVGDTAVFAEDASCLPVEFVGVCNLGQHPDYCLSREIEPATDVVIKDIVKVVLTKDFCLPGMVANVAGSCINRLQCFKKGLMLLFGRQEFNLGNQLHSDILLDTSWLNKKGGIAHPSVA